MKLLCAILGIMLACLAANAADVDILALHKQLQAEEPRCAKRETVIAASCCANAMHNTLVLNIASLCSVPATK